MTGIRERLLCSVQSRKSEESHVVNLTLLPNGNTFLSDGSKNDFVLDHDKEDLDPCLDARGGKGSSSGGHLTVNDEYSDVEFFLA